MVINSEIEKDLNRLDENDNTYFQVARVLPVFGQDRIH